MPANFFWYLLLFYANPNPNPILKNTQPHMEAECQFFGILGVPNCNPAPLIVQVGSPRGLTLEMLRIKCMFFFSFIFSLWNGLLVLSAAAFALLHQLLGSPVQPHFAVFLEARPGHAWQLNLSVHS